MTTDKPAAEALYRRVDESADELFYREPRFVTHIDAATIDALTDFYRESLTPDCDVLDLMSSWISHLPEEVPLGRVAGLGMNEAELAANPRLTDYQVHNLNNEPALPYPDASFDRVHIVVSIQYLVHPQAVLRSAHQVLRENGAVCIAMSHRLFPTKAILAFQELPASQRIALVCDHLALAGFDRVEYIDRSPANADPLWLVVAHR
jgi:SAM-dependent methyltransferase